MNARHTDRRTDSATTVVFVATAVFAGCVGVAATAWWSLDRIHAARTARSQQSVNPARPPATATKVTPASPLVLAIHVKPPRPVPAVVAVDPGREQFTRSRPPTFAAGFNEASHRLFNAASCAECHRQGGLGGGGPNENNVQLLTPLAIARNPILRQRFPAATGPVVLHRRSLSMEYDIWRAGLLKTLETGMPVRAHHIAFQTADGSPAPVPAATAPTTGVDTRTVLRNRMLEERNTPPLFGLGLIESIPQSEIDLVARNQPLHIRGRSPRLREGGLGRFGWKSSNATLLAFNENACAVELGLSTPSFTPATFRPAEITLPAGKSATQSEPNTRAAEPKALDMSADDVAALTRYIANLPAPRQVIPEGQREQVLDGARHFAAIGCAECHVPNMGSVTGIYSDLLLHQVGTEGGGFYGGSSSPSSQPNSPAFDIIRSNEFRTPPLWGVADSAPYLHDGSAGSLAEAIVRHTAQANRTNVAYQNSTPRAQAAVIAFLESLRAPQ